MPRFAATIFLVLIAVALAACGSSSSKHGSAATGLAVLSTKRCPTKQGIAQPASPLPTSVQLPMPSSQASGLVAYADSASTLLPAPKGWNCQSVIGADGTSRFSVFPYGETDPAAIQGGSAPQRGSPAGVSLDVYNGCQGCVNDLVCALFPKAKIVHTYAKLGGSCTQRNPPAQETHSAGPGLVLFRDPPGVRGQGVPSGGSIPAIGAVSLVDQAGQNGASAVQVTCAVKDDPDTCAAIVGAALATTPH